MAQQMAFDPELHLLLVADSAEQLRRVDVYRLFDDLAIEHWEAMLDYINAKQPEFLVADPTFFDSFQEVATW